MSSPPCWTCRKGATKTRLKEFLRSTSQADQAEPHGFLFLTSGVITPSSGSLPDVCLGIHRCHPKNGPNCFPYVAFSHLSSRTALSHHDNEIHHLYPTISRTPYQSQVPAHTLGRPCNFQQTRPRSHKGAGSLPITTGSYLFYFLGEKDASTSAQPKRNLRLSGVLMREMWYFG